jgi:Outer membrane protein beta-barrel domain
MKKFMFLPLVLGVMVANAQLKLGAKAGVNISNFTGLDEAVDHEALIGFHAGGVVRLKFNHLVVQPEVLYSTQGCTIKSNGTEKDYKLDYVNVPIMLQW